MSASAKLACQTRTVLSVTLLYYCGTAGDNNGRGGGEGSSDNVAIGGNGGNGGNSGNGGNGGNAVSGESLHCLQSRALLAGDQLATANRQDCLCISCHTFGACHQLVEIIAGANMKGVVGVQ